MCVLLMYVLLMCCVCVRKVFSMYVFVAVCVEYVVMLYVVVIV